MKSGTRARLSYLRNGLLEFAPVVREITGRDPVRVGVTIAKVYDIMGPFQRAMTKRPLLALPCALALGCGGLVPTDRLSHGGAVAGDITFEWTFAHQTCSQASVSKVQITLLASDGTPQALPPYFGYQGYAPGEFPCDSGGVEGVTLTNFAPDTYSYTLNGLDANRTLLYTAAGTVTVNGSQTVTVNLTAVPTATLTVKWTFGGLSCAQANVTSVQITLNDEPPVTAPCTGDIGDGVVLKHLALNTTYQIRLRSIDNLPPTNGLSHYALSTSAIASTTNPPPLSVDLQWAAASLRVQWTFGATFGSDCTLAGVGGVLLRLQDTATGQYATANGQLGECVPCSSNELDFSYLWAADSWVTGTTGSYFESLYTIDAQGFAEASCPQAATPIYVASGTLLTIPASRQSQTVTVDLSPYP